jgi:hypothetical protein
MKYQFLFLIAIACSTTACARPISELSPRERQAMVKRKVDSCLEEGVRDQDALYRCAIDKMCCSAPQKEDPNAPIFDASTGKMLTGDAARAARKRFAK